MKMIVLSFVLLWANGLSAQASGPQAQRPLAQEAVVLLHGLARTDNAMNKMANALAAAGSQVCNIGYPSTRHNIYTLAAKYVHPAIVACAKDVEALHVVTHSMGGIITRYLAKYGWLPKLGRVVMLSPPNQGSEVVDKLGGLWAFKWINGPAGQQLGTQSYSLPILLGPANFDLGVITGSRSINWILSSLIPGEDDGKVSIQHAKLEVMSDFLVIPATHPFIMKNKVVIEQTLHFLEHGAFVHTD